MFKRLLPALFLSLWATLAAAQGYINPPVYATGLVWVQAGTTVTTQVRNAVNPNNLNIFAGGAITTWNVILPAPPFDGEVISIGCPGGSVGTLNVSATGIPVQTGGPVFCTAGVGGLVQYQYSFNQNKWLLLAYTNTSGLQVTSVGLVDGSGTPIYAISNSPITTAGNLTFTLVTQTANKVFAGPGTGSAAQPTFRSLVLADLPSGIPNSLLANPAIIFGATSQALGSTIAALNAISIGATTPASGAFTTLSASGTAKFSGLSGGAIVGSVCYDGSNFLVPSASANCITGTTSPPTHQVFTAAGSGTYTTPVGVIRIDIEEIAGGGGGGGSGTSGAGAGGLGGTTSFNSITALGGKGGGAGSGSTAGVGGAVSGTGSGTAFRQEGAAGRSGLGGGSAAGLSGSAGPSGASSYYGGGGGGTLNGTAGGSAVVPGAGGGASGNDIDAGGNIGTGGSGGSGEYARFSISSPASSYSYTVGAAGTAGAAGSSGTIGGLGGLGYIYVTEYYN